jgi:hypothetical protein
MSGLVALAALFGGAMPAAAASVPSSAPAGASVGAAAALILSGKVSCGSAKTCLAVGVTLPASPTSTTVESWNGTAWKSVTVHAPKGASYVSLGGVSCQSPTYCLVTGEYLISGQHGGPRPFALTWNGTSMRPTPAPPLPKGVTNGILDGVSCVAVTSCVAVGTSFGNSLDAFVETWHGAKWALHTIPPPKGSAFLQVSGVSCLSLTRCVVAGETVPGTTGSTGVLLAWWNGKTLTPKKVPLPAGASNPIIADVSCASPASCAAVGDEINVSASGSTVTGFAFTEVWNGTAWKVTKIARPKGISASFLFGVSCPAAHHCVAAGGAGSGNIAHATAMSWNGRTWAAQHVPVPAKGLSAGFEGVSCTSAARCVAVGSIGPPSGSSERLLSGIWNGTAWKLAAH